MFDINSVSGVFVFASVLTDPLHNFSAHWDDMLTGGLILSFIAHMVQSFPPQSNPYVNWLLGGVQYIVGQRQRGQATMQSNGNGNGVSPPSTLKP